MLEFSSEPAAPLWVHSGGSDGDCGGGGTVTPPSPAVVSATTDICAAVSDSNSSGDWGCGDAHDSADPKLFSRASQVNVGSKRSREDNEQKSVQYDSEFESLQVKRARSRCQFQAASADTWLGGAAAAALASSSSSSNSNGTPPRTADNTVNVAGQPVLGTGGTKRGPGGSKSLSTLNRLHDVRAAVPPNHLKSTQPAKRAEEQQFQVDYLQADGSGAGSVDVLVTGGQQQEAEEPERLTAGGNRPKRPWLKEEDALLRSLVEKHGAKSWSLIAKEMTTRKGKQCRERWINHLDPRVRKGTFSAEEHQMVEEAVATIGHKWIEIAQLLPGRTDNAIKNYWNSLLRHAQRNAKRKALGKEIAGPTTKRSIAASRPLPTTIVSESGHSLTAKGVPGGSLSQLQAAKAEKEMLRCKQEIDLVQSVRPQLIARQTTVVG